MHKIVFSSFLSSDMVAADAGANAIVNAQIVVKFGAEESMANIDEIVEEKKEDPDELFNISGDYSCPPRRKNSAHKDLHASLISAFCSLENLQQVDFALPKTPNSTQSWVLQVI